MKGRSFETFEVTSGNREAYEYCRRVALLQEMGPSLALLLGPEGCGKSHLLWAIAKQVRLSTIPVGLALITPADFPDKVRDLADDPRPLQGRRAILLVDNLEGFEPEGRRLEAVIDTFLAHQQPVVIASNVHPNRLQKLSGPLRARFARSPAIAMEARVIEGAGPMEAYERFTILEKRIQELEQERDTVKQQLAVAFASAEDLAKEVVALKENNAALLAEADHAIVQQVRVQAALSAAKFELEEQRDLAATLAEREADLSAARAELEAQGDVVARLAEREAALGAAKSELEKQGDLAAKLAEREAALVAAEACVAGALERIEQMRAEHAAHRDELLSDINAMAEQLAPREDEAPLLQALAEASAEQEHVRAALAATRERLKAVEFEWAKSRKMLAIQTAEMDALRYTAATQVASASIQAGEMEHRIDTLETALSQVEGAALHFAGSLPEEGGLSRTLRAALAHMQAQLSALKKARAASQASSGIFDSDSFEVLPESFERGEDDPNQPHLPGLDEVLKNALQDVLLNPPPKAPEKAAGPSVPPESEGGASPETAADPVSGDEREQGVSGG